MFATTPASAPLLVCPEPEPLFEFWPEPEEEEFVEEVALDAKQVRREISTRGIVTRWRNHTKW